MLAILLTAAGGAAVTPAVDVRWIVAALIIGVALGWLSGQAQRYRARQKRSEITKSKHQLQAIFDGITDGLIIVDRDFTVAAVNKAEAAFLGCKPQEVVGKPCYEVYCRGDVACGACPAHETFATGKPALLAELEHVSATIERAWTSTRSRSRTRTARRSRRSST